MKCLVIFLVFTVFSILYLQDHVFACQCVADVTLQDVYDNSDFIFSATVLDVLSGAITTSDPPCKSEPRPDGEGWIFVDCKWQQYVDVPVDNCNKGSPPASKYAWNSQDCVWEWSPLRNENKSGPTPDISDESVCGSGAKLVDGVCTVIGSECKPDMYGNVYCDPPVEDRLTMQRFLFESPIIDGKPIMPMGFVIMVICIIVVGVFIVWRKRK